MTDASPSGPGPAPSVRRSRHVIGEQTLGWAVIGASAMARNHIVPAIRNQPPLPEEDTRYPVSSSHVVGVFSHDVSRARQFADAMHIPHAFVNFADLLARQDVHCVYVGGHPRHHAQAALAALAAGKHVLCETPMALALDEATAMTHTAAGAGLQLAVNYARRAEPAVHAMRQLLIAREIGDILGGRVCNMSLLEPALHTWRLLPNGGGVVTDRTVHSVDLVRWLLRDEVASVYADSTLQILSNVVEEDVVAQLIMRRTGRIVEVRDSYLVPHKATSVEVYGSAGTLIARHCLANDPPGELHLVRNRQRMAVPLETVQPYLESIGRFIGAVRNRGQALAGAGDGLQDLAVALAIRESIRTGQPVEISSQSRVLDDRSVL